MNDFVKKQDIDIAFLQEVNTDSFIVPPGYDFLANVGNDNRGTAIVYRLGYNVKNILCESDGRIISAVINNIKCINIYAPSGSQNVKERNEFFSSRITKHLDFHLPVVLIGDFNCIIKRKDSRNNTQLCPSLGRLVESLKFVDIWEHVHGNNVEFTFFRENCATRIDRAYISKEGKPLVHNVKVLPVPFSDHNALICYLKDSSPPSHLKQGYGYWKLKTTQLSNENVEQFRLEINNLKRRASYAGDFLRWWFIFKNQVKSFFRGKEIEKAVSAKNTALFYENVLFDLKNKINNGDNVFNEYREVKDILIQLREKSLQDRYDNTNNVSRFSERYSLYEYVKQRRINRPGIIQELVNDKSEKLSTTQDMLIYAKKFLEVKFKKSSASEQAVRCLLAHLKRKLHHSQSSDLVKPITREEILERLKAAQRKKTPGPDGISYEFYINFFDQVGDDLVRLFNLLLVQGCTPPKDFSKGVVVLIKKNRDTNHIEQYRTITLLNTDYKLLMKILAERLNQISRSVLSIEQTATACSSIFNNLMIIRDTILEFENKKRSCGALLTLDFYQAFDSVNHSYLWRVMERLGFDNKLIGLIQGIYKNASSRVLLNGYLSSEFEIETSVRQGCPLSMVLFSLALEPFVSLCKFSLEGFTIGQTK